MLAFINKLLIKRKILFFFTSGERNIEDIPDTVEKQEAIFLNT